MKNSFKNILKTHGDKLSPEITLENFTKFLGEFEDFKDLICSQDEKANSLDFYAKYLLDKYKKRVDHAIQKYIKTCIKEIKSEDHKFEDFESKINETESNKAYYACLKLVKKRELFETVIDKMRKGEDLSKLLPKESKKKRKKKHHHSHNHKDDASRKKHKRKTSHRNNSKSQEKKLGKRSAASSGSKIDDNNEDKVEKKVKNLSPIDEKMELEVKPKGKEEGELEIGEVKIDKKLLKKSRGHKRKRNYRSRSRSGSSSSSRSNSSGSSASR